ncbi:MAG: cytochrome c biogenesis protein CcsA [Fuerstiella sp.]
MAFLSNVQLSCFLFSYLVAFSGEIIQLLRQRTSVVRWVLLVSTLAGLVAHTAYLASRSQASGLPPLVGSSHDWLLVLAWVAALLYFIAQISRQPAAMGLFLIPAMLIPIAMAVFVEDASVNPNRAQAAYRWGLLHASTLIIGIGCVSIATICGLMYLLHYQKLTGRNSWLHNLRFPSLEQLTIWNRRLVVAAVIMLTLGMLTGMILGAGSSAASGVPFGWVDPIVIGTFVVWAAMVAALWWLLTRPGQSGRQVAKLTLTAGAFLLFTVFGLVLLTGGVHGSAAAGDSPAEKQSDDKTKHGKLSGENQDDQAAGDAKQSDAASIRANKSE